MFAFIDESGFPHPNDGSLHSVLLGICVRKEDIRELSSRVHQIKEAVYGGNSTIEIKATKLINPRTLKPNYTDNKKFVDKLFDMIESQNSGVYAMVLERPDEIMAVDPDKLPMHYTYLLYRINAHAMAKRRIVAVVFDGQDAGSDENISDRFHNFVYNAALSENILEMPLFVSSKIVSGIQIADIMAGVVRHYFNAELHTGKMPETPFDEWIIEKFAIIQKKTYNHRINNHTAYGIHLSRKTAIPIVKSS